MNKKDYNDVKPTDYIDCIIEYASSRNGSIVELGTRYGDSLSKLRDAFPDKLICTYDYIEDSVAKKVAQQNNIKYIIGNTKNCRYPFKEKIGVLFCDTTHDAKQLISEYNNFRKHLSKNAVIIIDDVFLNDKSLGFMNIIGAQYVIGAPIRANGLGIITSLGKWHKAKYIEHHSLPPIITKLYEIWARIWYHKVYSKRQK